MTPLPESLLGDTRWLRRLARSLVDDPHDAADVVQDTVVRALQLPEQKVERPRSFLAAVMRNLVYDRRRREGKRPEVERHAARRAFVAGTGDVVEQAAAKRSLVEAVRRLDEPYRGALWMRFFEELPPREIALRLSVPVETARTRLKRGLAQLRVSLDREFGKRAAWLTPLSLELGLKSGVGAGGVAMGASSSKMGFGGVVMTTAAAATAACVLALWPTHGPDVDLLPAGAHPLLAAAPAPTTDAPADGHRPSPAAGDKAEHSRSIVPATRQDAQPTPTPIASAAPALAAASGFVVDEQTRLPLADVSVAWRSGNTIHGVVKTDTSGRFRISTDGVVLDAEESPLQLVVQREDFVTTHVDIRHGDERELRLGEVALPPGTSVSGRVLDARGLPAAGMRILAVLESELSFGWPPGSAVETRAMLENAREIARTDARGEFVATERLAPSSNREVLIALGPAGVGWQDAALRRSRSRVDVDLQLQPAAPFEAWCRDQDGAPVAGVRATLEPKFFPLGTEHAPVIDAVAPHPELRSRLTAVSDDEGLLRFDGVPVPPGQQASDPGYALKLEAQGFVPRRYDDVALASTAAGRLEVRLQRTKPLRLTGTVRDAMGRGVAGVAVVARAGENAEETHLSRTDAYGRYTIDGLENSLQGAVALAKAEGYAVSLGFVAFGDNSEARLDLELEEKVAAPAAVAAGSSVSPLPPKSLHAHLLDAYGGALDAKSARLVETETRHALPLRLTIGRVEAEGLYPGDWLLQVTSHEGAQVTHRFEVRPEHDAVWLTCVEPKQAPGARSVRDAEESVTLRSRHGELRTMPLRGLRGT